MFTLYRFRLGLKDFDATRHPLDECAREATVVAPTRGLAERWIALTYGSKYDVLGVREEQIQAVLS